MHDFRVEHCLQNKMNRKEEYDSYEIEEPSDEERAGSRYVCLILAAVSILVEKLNCKQTTLGYDSQFYVKCK